MRTLLLADESVTVQRVIALTFAEEPIQVVTVADGQQAMERVVSQRPDIVLAGTTLPQVSGYDLAKFIRSKPELRNVPVLLLSGAFETVDEARLASSGANGVLEKPVEPTVVIGRVKELLGLKAETKPPAAGRLVTSAESPAGKKLPVATPPRAVTSTKGTPSRWEQLRNQTGLDPDTRSVEDSSTRPDDYLDTLDAAFDSLDRQLSGRTPATKPQRNPSGPLGQAGGASDPRSPGRRPTPADSQSGSPVFEVDDEWFGTGESAARADAIAGQQQIVEDLRDPELNLHAPAPSRTDPIYEVDEDWFAEGDKKRAEKLEERQHLAAEMGIHEVELPAVAHPADIPAPSKEDFDFGLEDLKQIVAEAPAPAAAVAVGPPASEPPPAPPAPLAIAPLPSVVAAAPAPPVINTARASSPVIPANTVVADDFAALLAFEQGERKEPPMPPPPEIRVVTPEITDEMLEEIATRVADRLTASSFGAQLQDAIAATMRQSVNEAVSAAARPIVSETSERVVREVVSETAERVVREVVSQNAERVLRDVVAQTADRSMPGAVSQAVDRSVPEAVSQAVERAVPGAISQAVDRAVPGAVADAVDRAVPGAVSDAVDLAVSGAVSQAVERVVPGVVSQAVERAVPDVVSHAAERLVHDAVGPATDRVVRDVVAQTAAHAVRDAAAQATERVAREVVQETSERLVREEIERIRSRRSQ